MTRPAGPPRVVIDTNLVLSALVFAEGRLTPLRQAWQARRIRPLVSRVTAAELIRVLAYPKFRLTPEEQRELLADYLPCCETVRIPNPPPKTPACRDPFDVPFLQLALAGKAKALVTGDRDLLSLARGFACPILSADQFIDSLQ
ncbi:MAG: putative toxin-antitoxin system toxin component, PIN family [Zoogloeaceae bacterium]|nr:putative toxin-antitoxin system toxin component, PIN family [Zoogloeaceae bacterium]MCK6383912.1 putative toxin-antitoxin system toxin component, PIN family [Rhodocyclaceae bacterium]